MTDAGAVQLVPCSDPEYVEFASAQVVEYARQLVQAGEASSEEGIATARERLADLAADRLRTAGHDFYVARSTQNATRVGWVWLSPAPHSIQAHLARWLSQLTVLDTLRGQGWGRAILEALEQHERNRGSEEIWLRVFDWNLAAKQLYLSRGYEVVQKFATDAHLRKRLVPAAERLGGNTKA